MEWDALLALCETPLQESAALASAGPQAASELGVLPARCEAPLHESVALASAGPQAASEWDALLALCETPLQEWVAPGWDALLALCYVLPQVDGPELPLLHARPLVRRVRAGVPRTSHCVLAEPLRPPCRQRLRSAPESRRDA